MSDIVELYDGDNRDFFYCERCGFSPVRFDAEQAKPMQETDGDLYIWLGMIKTQ